MLEQFEQARRLGTYRRNPVCLIPILPVFQYSSLNHGQFRIIGTNDKVV